MIFILSCPPSHRCHCRLTLLIAVYAFRLEKKVRWICSMFVHAARHVNNSSKCDRQTNKHGNQRHSTDSKNDSNTALYIAEMLELSIVRYITLNCITDNNKNSNLQYKRWEQQLYGMGFQWGLSNFGSGKFRSYLLQLNKYNFVIGKRNFDCNKRKVCVCINVYSIWINFSELGFSHMKLKCDNHNTFGPYYWNLP